MKVKELIEYLETFEGGLDIVGFSGDDVSEEGDDIKRMGNRISQARQGFQKRNDGVRFTQRIWEEDEVIGIRVWRVE